MRLASGNEVSEIDSLPESTPVRADDPAVAADCRRLQAALEAGTALVDLALRARRKGLQGSAVPSAATGANARLAFETAPSPMEAC